MDFFDAAQQMLDRGVSLAEVGVATAKKTMADHAIEQQSFVQEFVRMCADAYQQGWHEANGGNLSYLLTEEQAEACRTCLDPTPGEWVPLPESRPLLAGSFVLVTASGKHFRNVAVAASSSLGLIEVGPAGTAWRRVWGFQGGAKPTSELLLHLACLEAKMVAGVEARVTYHAHPAQVMALTALFPVDSKALTLTFWQGIAEAIIMVPRGVEELPWMVPGTSELAAACAEGLSRADAVVAVNHGVFCCCPSFDAAFGLMHTLDKAAQVHLLARAANGGSTDFTQKISREGLRHIAQRYGLAVAEDVLDDEAGDEIFFD